ncbi:YugE family protein [Staphylococcus americanisciuri]|uniref:YugE family protein n=1 Tax=Staphylococcus americanisciuri TaxID=2973940 RepID=A0ABT2F3M6_9STAP|nr:YugE family protein [Staphylococcus americanisciuri]MCS4486808.1 YugE family protein [Staphylococcus americanisciuri]
MSNNELNIQLYQLLAAWNPMHFDDPTLGDAEVYEMMDAIHHYGEPIAIADAFQQIFQFSFEVTLPKDACLQKATEAIQLQQTCQLN